MAREAARDFRHALFAVLLLGALFNLMTMVFPPAESRLSSSATAALSDGHEGP